MKNLIGITSLLFSMNAFAAPALEKLAVSAVQGLDGRPGDKVVTEYKGGSKDSKSTTEVWEVVLSNGPSVGSAIYKVTIKKALNTAEGKELASISIVYVNGN